MSRLAALLHRWLRFLMDVVARVYFRRLETTERDRLPANGAILVVANHPAAWTDVLVLEIALGRELHFVAHESLFRPWIRRLFLNLFESLPVRYRHEGPLAAVRNRETFDHCHALFRLGGAIAVFPEGTSGSDRRLYPLKTGAARLLLEHVAAGDAAPAVIPVAIHYEDRTRFRTRVDVAVGPPIPTAAAGGDHRDFDAAAHALTAGMARALAATLADAAAHASGREPGTRPDASASAQLRIAAVLARILAAAGVVLHAPPAAGIEWVARCLTGLPQQIAFGRIVSGLVLIPLWYGVLVALAAVLGGGAWFAIPASAPILAVLTCREIDRLHREAANRALAGGERA